MNVLERVEGNLRNEQRHGNLGMEEEDFEIALPSMLDFAGKVYEANKGFIEDGFDLARMCIIAICAKNREMDSIETDCTPVQ